MTTSFVTSKIHIALKPPGIGKDKRVCFVTSKIHIALKHQRRGACAESGFVTSKIHIALKLAPSDFIDCRVLLPAKFT